MRTRKVIVLPYDRGWAADFQKIKEELEQALGDLILTIEHVGSTAVEGLSAKPCIDLDVVIRDYDLFPAVVEKLAILGYFHEGNLGIPGREAFGYSHKPHLQKHHLYVCPADSRELHRHLTFRDYLRAHPEAVKKYSSIKEEAARRYPDDIDQYMAHKAPCIEELYKLCGLSQDIPKGKAAHPMHFYCQLDYEHISYPSPTSPYGNLANNGCGVCCASMVVETLTGVDFPPEQSAVLAKSCGAREGFGTDMRIFAPAFARKKGLCWESTQDPQRVLEFLHSGKGVVIANTAGDREGWIGVFSDSRHYVVVAAAAGSTVCVWDPLLAPGRYDIPGRAGKVRLDGFNAWADFSVIVGDCGSRPFYLFWK